MKIKRLLVLAVLPMMCLAANAQNCSKDNTPKKGDFTVAATVGYNSYTNVTAPSGLLTDYEVRALSTNWADKKLMVGFEGGWFFKDQWKLNLGGGVSFTNNPGYPAVPGTIDENTEIGDIEVCVLFSSPCCFRVFRMCQRDNRHKAGRINDHYVKELVVRPYARFHVLCDDFDSICTMFQSQRRNVDLQVL